LSPALAVSPGSGAIFAEWRSESKLKEALVGVVERLRLAVGLDSLITVKREAVSESDGEL
jgi:hypothetical protein